MAWGHLEALDLRGSARAGHGRLQRTNKEIPGLVTLGASWVLGRWRPHQVGQVALDGAR